MDSLGEGEGPGLRCLPEITQLTQSHHEPELGLELSESLSPLFIYHLMRRVDSLEKTDAGRDCGQEEKGMTEDEMAGWHH